MAQMMELMKLAVRVAAIGTAATGLLDLWSMYQVRTFKARTPDYGQVGRWLGHLARGRIGHRDIAAAAPIPGEQVIGWASHYATGVAFAAGLLALVGPCWLKAPAFAPALAFGLATVIFPFLILQPATGAGVAASKTPDPTAARLRSLGNHAVFGVGLYVAAWVLTQT